jgi:hypothetical protein
MNNKLRTTTMTLAVLGIIVPGTAPAAECTLWADQPKYNGSISGEGSWANCPSNAKVTVLLRRDHKWWPDSTLRSQSGTGRSGRLNLLRGCGAGFDFWKVYIETRYGSKKTQSPRAVLPCG